MLKRRADVFSRVFCSGLSCDVCARAARFESPVKPRDSLFSEDRKKKAPFELASSVSDLNVSHRGSEVYEESWL